MNAEIIAVGTELLLGQIVNTNAQFLGQELAALGIGVYYHTVVCLLYTSYHGVEYQLGADEGYIYLSLLDGAHTLREAVPLLQVGGGAK